MMSGDRQYRVVLLLDECTSQHPSPISMSLSIIVIVIIIIAAIVVAVVVDIGWR
jgi:hypothetical protein